ncbi:hypothetical protein WMY93_010987 [Mugilogobius chulae]|uniref:Uncharacterized protein n=1 Tax=Mugilogobius chulae TaxID=88201 RepID=A0AAW0P906_9GOBI
MAAVPCVHRAPFSRSPPYRDSTVLVSNKEKKSFSKKLFRRSSVRSVGSFMNRVLRTLSTLSHFSTDEQSEQDEQDKESALIPAGTTGGSAASDDSDCGGFPFLGTRSRE